jgi:putative phosphoserine phosphatase/1-acylglycerol-3-phosphate O-acyltransferase
LTTSPQLRTRTEPTRIAAIFDFDGTLIDGYSALAALADRARRGDIGPSEALKLVASGAKVAMGQAGIEDFMRTGVLALRGRPVAELDDFGRRLTRTALGGRLFPEAVRLIASHQKRGHLVVIASSALSFQVDGLAEELGVDRVVCTRLGEQGGVCTGEIDGEVLWGVAKANAVRSLAATEGIDLERSYSYANGNEDIEFLATAGHPTAVNPGSELERVANERSWAIQRFTNRPRPGASDAARTVAAYSGLLTSCCVGATVGLLNRSRRDAANLTFALGGDLSLSLAGVRLKIVGEHNLWSARPAVFIFNHQSLLDGFIALKLIRSDFTGVAKKEMGRVPILAQFAWLTNVALVDRADSQKTKATLEPVVERLRQGYSIAIAPEGTRSVTPRVGRFKKGAFHLAMQGRVPIVPIVIRNAGDLQWRGSRLIQSGQIDVAVLPPIGVEEWTRANLDDKVAGVRSLFIDALDGWDATVASVRDR